MRAMVLDAPGQAVQIRTLPCPQPTADQLLIKVAACAVCRTDLHVVDGDLPNPKLPIIPGHEIVGRVVARGPMPTTLQLATGSGSHGWGGLAGVAATAQAAMRIYA